MWRSMRHTPHPHMLTRLPCLSSVLSALQTPRTSTGDLWEGPGDLSHCLPVISGPPAGKNFSSPFRVKNETRCIIFSSTTVRRRLCRDGMSVNRAARDINSPYGGCWNTEVLASVWVLHWRGEGDGRIKQERGEFLTKRTTTRTYIFIGYKTIFTFIGCIIQLFSLDKIYTIIHFGFGLAALTFSVLYFTSRAPRSSCYYYIRLSRAADQATRHR
jgi:hypothetical protein